MADYTYSEQDKFVQIVGEEDYHERIAEVQGEQAQFFAVGAFAADKARESVGPICRGWVFADH